MTIENIFEKPKSYQVMIGPWHDLFKQFKVPACQVCFQPIVAGDMVDISYLDDGRYQVNHATCVNDLMDVV